MSIENKLKQARIKMFRKDVGLMLFGACAYKFNWKVEKLDPSIEGYVLFNPEKISELIDGNIHLNEHYVSMDDYNHDNVIALIIHELLHILQKHGSRRGTREPKAWNFATDHVIDRDLKKLGLKPYQNRFNIIKDLDIAHPNCSAEEAYNWIQQNMQRFQFSGSDQNGYHFTVTDNQTGEKYDITINPGDTTKLSDTDKEKIKHKIDQFVSEARALNQTIKEKEKKDKGSKSGHIQSYLDKLLEVEIDWSTLLEKAIKTNVILKPTERSWRKLNPYYTPHGMTLPGMAMGDEKENVGLLVLLVDTSGSISDVELMKFAYVLNKSLYYFSEVRLITHDSMIHQKVTFEQEDFIKFYDFIKSIGFHGRGGTSHRDCFKYIQKEIWEEREKRDLLSMVISLTDGYSDIEHEYQNYKWIKSTPLVFICTSKWEFKDPQYENIETIKIK